MGDVRFSLLIAAGLAMAITSMATGSSAYGEDLSGHQAGGTGVGNPSGHIAAGTEAKPPGTPAQAIFTATPPPTPPGTTIEKANGPPPPVPQGPFVPGGGQPIPFTPGAIVSPSPGTPSPDPPGDFHFFVKKGLSVPSASFSSVDEPSAASHDDTPNPNKAILYTGNWYAAVSTDNGGSFKYMNPFKFGDETVPPGGFCCDQQAIYTPSRDLYFWLRQYNTTGGCDNQSPPNCTGNNVYRIAVAHGAAAVANGN
jgi:hypothetical protein